MAGSIQEDIQTLRQAGLPQDEIARRLGVDRITLWRWERGLYAPRMPELWCIAHLWAEQVRQRQSQS